MLKNLIYLCLIGSLACSDTFSAWTEKLEIACGEGSTSACEALGTHYLIPEGINSTPRDAAKGRFYMNKATMMKKKDTIKRDYFRLFEEHTDACEKKIPERCYRLGQAYENGLGVRQDYSQAKKYYGKACDLRDQDGCNGYARLNRKGIE